MKILRKTAAVILCFILIAALFPTPEFSAADGELIDGVSYKIDGDHAVVTGCSDTATEITVRSKYNNYPVTQIADSAFKNKTSLKKVTIANSVTNIGNSAFYGCSGLTSITIPDSVTSIENYAFYKCTGLTSIMIPDSVTSIGPYAFNGCEYVTYISAPMRYLTKNSLSQFPQLLTVKIADGCKTIEKNAFSGRTDIKNITIPDSVTSIENSAFSGCTGLTSIMIPDSVTSIGESAFDGCRGLTSITIPDGVTSIGDNAFNRCTGLTEITIPDSVTSIGEYAFYGCSGLTSITIPDSVTSIGWDAFSGCTGLTSITIPDSVTSIGNWAFSRCAGLTSITIPDSVTSIGEYAFSDCTGLTSITIPDSVTHIGKSTFSYCKNLTDVKLPNNLTAINDYVFNGCKSLKTVNLPKNLTYLGISAFSNTAIESIEIPKSLSKCGTFEDSKYGPFSNCSQLKNITFEEGITTIPDYIFSYCDGIETITIPDSVTKIGWYAFYGCSRFASITIPDSVTSIGWNAFSNCENLTIRTVKGSYADTYAQNNSIPVYYYLNKITPETPMASTLTENSVVLAPTDGYEYRMDDGEWQDSNVFENLTRNSSHKFYQRMKATANCPESFSSPAADISTLDHNYGKEIIPPTKNSPGYTLHTCTLCGDTYKDNYTFYEPGETDPLIEVSSVRGIVGNQVKVAISLKNNPGIASMSLKLDYDANILKLVKVEDRGILGEQVHNPSLGVPYYLSWVNDTATENFTENGNIVILTFEILEDAPLGKTPISVSYDYDDFDIYDVNGEKVAFATQNGTVDVATVLLGDVNGDGIVNNYDRLLLTRWLAKWPEALEKGIIEAAADVNCDGKVNNLDRLILTRHLAHWAEYATLPYTK